MTEMKNMKRFVAIIVTLAAMSFLSGCFEGEQTAVTRLEQSNLSNSQMRAYPFLRIMSNDTYFPGFLVKKGQALLVDLCFQIEAGDPKTETELFKLTHATTKEFNALQGEFLLNDSEFETVAVEAIVLDYGAIASAYGFNPPLELLVGPSEFW